MESRIGKSLFDLGFVKGRIVKCTLFCLLQLRQNIKIFSNKIFYIILHISSLTRETEKERKERTYGKNKRLKGRPRQ